MKSVLVRLLIALCLIHSFSAGAVDVGNLRYDLNDSNLTATVSGLVGGSGAASGSLDIPEYVEYIGKKYSVTAIGEDAFSGYSHFTGSLTIPNSVTAIGNNAFSGCSGFTGSLTIPNSVTAIGNNAFSVCSQFTGSMII
ncbi:MAG: leucine-rich repeat domain-containing protein, partial [Paramuribaculum sp.]|nr:leucine-rich repeat domain-containing protein [Paramuribaculum sp.]